MKIEFRTLEPDEIEIRVSKVQGNGVSLLLYKNARVDQQLLDEIVGPLGWQRRHPNGNENCIVSIWDSDKQQWIEKEDTGSESASQAKKGLASNVHALIGASDANYTQLHLFGLLLITLE